MGLWGVSAGKNMKTPVNSEIIVYRCLVGLWVKDG